ncbi:MAG: hypothetical protein WCO00_03495 [Rhodospirillaceae bacterium]
MTGDRPAAELVSHRRFILGRRRRSLRRLAEGLHQLSVSVSTVQDALGRIARFFEQQHRQLQEAIVRSDEIERFCARCQEIIDGGDADRMARDRDWLLAGYRKRHAHRRAWLDRLGVPR